jgi:hypothetical protein
MIDIFVFIRMAYIEENLKLRSRPVEEPEEPAGPLDPQEELFRTVADRWKVDKKPGDDGSVTNSLTMLTAIPEVDLGMECVLLPHSSIRYGQVTFLRYSAPG